MSPIASSFWDPLGPGSYDPVDLGADPPVDGGDDTSTVATPPAAPPEPPPNAGLPDVLLETPNAKVIHGTDPGDFYCEHVFYVSQTTAASAESTVAWNAFGERLVGFLHVPGDDFTGGGGHYTEAARHAGTREVVGAALRGYYEDLSAAEPGDPLRILVTGFGPFGDILDNPTGDFVAHRENLDASMRAAFGSALLTPEGTPVAGGEADGARTFSYVVRDPASGRPRTLEVRAQVLPVADSALDPANGASVEDAYAAFRPGAVISLGVAASSPAFMAEHHADDGGMRRFGAAFRHVEGAPEATTLPDNYSLARAILRGSAVDT